MIDLKLSAVHTISVPGLISGCNFLTLSFVFCFSVWLFTECLFLRDIAMKTGGLFLVDATCVSAFFLASFNWPHSCSCFGLCDHLQLAATLICLFRTEPRVFPDGGSVIVSDDKFSFSSPSSLWATLIAGSVLATIEHHLFHQRWMNFGPFRCALPFKPSIGFFSFPWKLLATKDITVNNCIQTAATCTMTKWNINTNRLSDDAENKNKERIIDEVELFVLDAANCIH